MRDKLNITGKKKSKLLIFIVVLLLLTAFGKLVVSSTLAGQGQELSELEAEEIRITQENRLVTEEIAKSASITKVAMQSAEIGLVRVTKTVYLELSQSVAQLPSNGVSR